MTRDSMSISPQWSCRGGSNADHVPWCSMAASRTACAGGSSCTSRLVRHDGERDHPIDTFGAAMPELAQSADGLQPAEDLLDQLSLLLADRVAGATRGSIVDGVTPGWLIELDRPAPELKSCFAARSLGASRGRLCHRDRIAARTGSSQAPSSRWTSSTSVTSPTRSASLR